MNKYINYRPEIDGLRTIAVFSVIFYHSTITIFEKKLFPGGFIGVDIFFVISGYLITKIILNEIKKTEKFSFINFYKRRAKRILPALLFVILLTFPFIYVNTPPNFLNDYVNSIISIILFISNYFFWSLGAGYDQLQNIQFQPFLHAWTLSLEEQFYIFFPIIFILINKIFKKKLFFFVFVGFITSLFLSDYMSRAHASVNFYFLPTRVWEFLAGTILVLIEQKNLNQFNNIINKIFIGLGLVLISLSLIFFDDQMFLPSIITLMPVIGVCLVIFFHQKENFFIKVLSSTIFTSLGKISYSLYLWHYPVFIIYKNLNFFFQLLIIFIFSLVSYFFIERKFRYNLNSKFFSIKTIFAVSLIILISIFFFSKTLKNIDYEKYPKILQDVLKKKFLTFHPNNGLEKDIFYQSKVSLYIAGDSHMNELYKELSKDKRTSEFNLINQNLSNGCYYVYDFYRFNNRTKKKLNPCTIEDQQERRNNFLSQKNSIVVLGGRLPLWLNSNNNNKVSRFDKKDSSFSSLIYLNDNNISLEQGIKDSINDLLNNGLKVIIVYPVPILDFHPIKEIFESYRLDKNNFEINLKKKPFVVSYSSFLNYANKSHKLLNSISHPNLYKIFTHELFCKKSTDQCMVNDEEGIFYIDNNHLSSYGNKIIVNEIFKIIKK